MGDLNWLATAEVFGLGCGLHANGRFAESVPEVRA